MDTRKGHAELFTSLFKLIGEIRPEQKDFGVGGRAAASIEKAYQMDRDIIQYAIAGLGGLILGTSFGRKVPTEAIALLEAIETRLGSIEGLCTGLSGPQISSSTAHAAAVEKHAAAIAKLADAIETHAAAVDDHGAATVAAAVESHAALQPPASARSQGA